MFRDGVGRRAAGGNVLLSRFVVTYTPFNEDVPETVRNVSWSGPPERFWDWWAAKATTLSVLEVSKDTVEFETDKARVAVRLLGE